MFFKPRSRIGAWRYLVKDGHEYISLMPFFMVFTARWGLGAAKNTFTPMNEKNCKKNYASPTVEVLNARVEAGYQTSNPQGNANTTRYNEGSWDTPSGNSNARYN